jgi:aminocarboxymuconate-semialdehyde decarboxylase
MHQLGVSKGLAVDAHGHCIPQRFLEDVVRMQPLGVHCERVDGKYIVTFPGHKALRPIGGVMIDTTDRLAWFEVQGIGHQIVAPWLDLQGQEMPTRTGAEWVRLLNDSMAEAVSDASLKLSAHATLHLADAGVATEELCRAVTQLGMSSVMIPTSLPTGRLADAGYDELWSAAVKLDVPVLLHATTKSPANDLLKHYPSLQGLFGRYIDTTLVAAELIVAGVLERFPDLRLLIVHGGGFLPYQAVRFDRDTKGTGTRLRIPSEVVRSLYYDTTLMSSESVRFLYDYVGSERIVVGSDFGATANEHADVRVTEAVLEAGVAPEVTRAVLSGNARRLFRLDDLAASQA